MAEPFCLSQVSENLFPLSFCYLISRTTYLYAIHQLEPMPELLLAVCFGSAFAYFKALSNGSQALLGHFNSR